MNSIKMAFNQASLLVYLCIGLSYLKPSSCTIVCNVQPEKPIVGQQIEFTCSTIGPASNETKLSIRTQKKTVQVTTEVGKNGELSATYTWQSISDVEINIKCKEKVYGNTTNICTKTVPRPIPISEPTSLSTMEKTTISDPTEVTQKLKVGLQTEESDSSETQIILPTSSIPTTIAVGKDHNESFSYYFTTFTYEEEYDDVEEYDSKGLSLFDLYPMIFWGLIVGLVIIFFVVIIATMCLVFLTQSKRRKEREHSNVPFTRSMEVLTGPFRKPAGAYLDLNDASSHTPTPNTVDRACQTLPCNLPWLAIDVDDGYELNGDIVARPASVAGCGNLELEPNVLGRGGCIHTRHGLTRSESDRRYSAVCRTRTELDPQFYVPQQRRYRHSDHEMYHLQKYNNQGYDDGYDAQPIAAQFLQEPVRRYRRRANQIGTRQSRPYSYIDPSIAQLVPPSASGKPKAGNRDEYSDSTL